MSIGNPQKTERGEDARALRECLAGIVHQIAGREMAVVDWERREHPGRSWYGAQILKVNLADGRELSLFWKDYRSERGPQPKPARQRTREYRLYRDFLACADLGTPRYYGAAWDETAPRFWLFLEYVELKSLAEEADPGSWREAARWLARLQHRFAQRSRETDVRETLFEQSVYHFRNEAERAAKVAATVSTDLADQLGRVIDRYDEISAAILDGPQALVHREFHAGHVLLDTSLEPVRLCVIDWEHAALGSSLYDLAELTYGLSRSRAEQLLEVYLDERRQCDMEAIPDDRARRALAACSVHQSIRRVLKLNRVDGRASTLGDLVHRAVETGKEVMDS